MKEKYTHYEDSLLQNNLESLEVRRQRLALKFAKDCINNEKFKYIFPRNDFTQKMKTRNEEEFHLPHANTNRMMTSSIPYMINLLNKEQRNINKSPT